MNEISMDSIPDKAFTDTKIFLDKNFILLCPETPVTPELKERLSEWGYKSVFAETPPRFTNISSLQETEGMLLQRGSGESEQEDEASVFYKGLLEFTSEVYRSFTEKNELRLPLIADKVKEITIMLKTHKTYLLNFSAFEDEDFDYGISQSVKTAILSLAMADVMKFPAHKQLEIGIAALLHRIGVVQIPGDIFYADRKLTPDEKKNITLFPVLGFRILKGMNFPLPIALAVLEHREKMDGTGYPRRLSGDKISLYGRLLSVASSYCAAVSPRPFRENLDGHSGILDMIKDKGRTYDDKILRILIMTITVYPVGTFVELNNGSVGIVYQTNSEEPRFPVLRMLLDDKKTVFTDSPILHTSPSGELQIERALGKDEAEEIKARIRNRDN